MKFLLDVHYANHVPLGDLQEWFLKVLIFHDEKAILGQSPCGCGYWFAFYHWKGG